MIKVYIIFSIAVAVIIIVLNYIGSRNIPLMVIVGVVIGTIPFIIYEKLKKGGNDET